MHKSALAAFAAATIVSASSAMASPLGLTSSPPAVSSMVDQVRLVCNQWGRCWRTGPRFVYGGGYYRPRPFYGPRYYGGPHYRHGPSVRFNFGGPRW